MNDLSPGPILNLSVRRPFCTVIACALLLVTSCSTAPNRPIRESDYPQPIRVACVGDSITFGYGFKDRERESYPAQLQALLGDHWQVRNFGFNGATALKQGTKPYSALPVYQEALSFKPNVVIIKLGTNDTNQKSWPAHKDEFLADYLERALRLAFPPRFRLNQKHEPTPISETRRCCGNRFIGSQFRPIHLCR